MPDNHIADLQFVRHDIVMGVFGFDTKAARY